MNALELREAIKDRVCEAAKKNIWERALSIVTDFGKVERQVENSYTISKYDYEVAIAGKRIKLHRSHNHYAQEYIVIRVAGRIVFQAREVFDEYQYRAPYDRERMMRTASTKLIFVEVCVLGEWVDWLDPKVIQAALEDQRRGRENQERLLHKQREQEALEQEKKRPLSSTELELAEKFGVAV